jgi:cytochrome c
MHRILPCGRVFVNATYVSLFSLGLHMSERSPKSSKSHSWKSPSSITFALSPTLKRERIDLMAPMKFLRGGISRSLVFAALALMSASVAPAQDKRALEGRGEGLLTINCARCHAVGRSGDSTHPEAPPFRTLGQRYPIEVLAEALAEGLSSGHPDMPEFRFEIDDVNAILAYLESIQEKDQGAPAK